MQGRQRDRETGRRRDRGEDYDDDGALLQRPARARDRETETQRHRDTETQGHRATARDSETARQGGRETERPRGRGQEHAALQTTNKNKKAFEKSFKSLDEKEGLEKTRVSNI